MNQKNRSRLVLTAVFLLAFDNAIALSTDKDKDIEIEANNAELDDKKGITIYRGNVVVTQGSIRITGDIMTVTYKQDKELDTVIVEGQPAHYRQLPDNKDIYDEAEALRMEYYAAKSFIVLIENAQVKQEGLRFSGNRIEYDTLLSQVKAKGKTKTTEESGKSTPSDADSRVKITIKSKKKNTDQNN
ncbi:MAG: lipopolysaccharide transport periplasmic protein LptA [Gammaproteobacteria bacterium RBG_16_51_14]|nr:MAG: lipopolysaccharide transport periplasmic protein LptA [Gammaproteobacteria bacterium RBG_16_51_14]